MQRVALLNGENLNQDYDLSKIFQSLALSGIGEGLQVINGKVTPGYAFINISRDQESFNILFQNTSDVIIDTTGTKKVFIELDQSKIDDGSSNNSNGTGIGEIKIADNYPASNFIKLASITSGVIIDEREKIIHKFENLSGEKVKLIAKSDGKIEIQKANGELGILNLNNINTSDILLNGSGIGTAGGLVKTDSENRLIGDGSLLTGVIAESEKVFIKGLIPAFSVGEGIYPLRKGYKKGEDTSKVYIFDKTAGDMESVGFYFGETDGFDDPESFFGGKQGEVYGPNIFGGLIQHNQNKISKLVLKGYGMGVGDFNLKIAPLDEFGNIDLLNSIVDSQLPINTFPLTYAVDPTEFYVDLNGTSWVSVTDKTFTATQDGEFSVKWDMRIEAYTWYFRVLKNGVQVYSSGGITSSSYTNYNSNESTFNVSNGDVITFQVRKSTSNQRWCYVKNIEVFPVSAETEVVLDFPEAEIIPNTDYGFVLVKSDGDELNKIKLTHIGQGGEIFNLSTNYNVNSSSQYMRGSYNGEMNGSLIDLDIQAEITSYSGQNPTFAVKQSGATLGSVSNSDGANTYVLKTTTITGVDLSKGPLEFWDIANSDSSSESIRNRVVTMNNVTQMKLFSSTSGSGGIGTAKEGGIYSKVISENPITAINSIKTGIIEMPTDIQDNTKYYVGTDGLLKTERLTNLTVGKSISKRKILVEDELSKSIFPGTDELFYSDYDMSYFYGNSWGDIKNFTIGISGYFNFKVITRYPYSNGTGYSRLLVDGKVISTITHGSSGNHTINVDVFIGAGKTIQIQGYNSYSTSYYVSADDIEIRGVRG